MGKWGDVNERNLTSFGERTTNEQREIAKKGGVASGHSRRRAKSMKQVFRTIKDLPVQDAKLKAQLRTVGITDEDTTYAAALGWSAVYHAMKGNSQMMRLVFEMMGEDPALTLKEKEYRLKEKALKEENMAGAGDDVVIIDNLREADDGNTAE